MPDRDGWWSEQAEIHLDRRADINGRAVFHPGDEFPLKNRLRGFFVEAKSEALHESNLPGLTAGADDERERDRTVVLQEPGDLAVCRVDLMSDMRRTDFAWRYFDDRLAGRFGVSYLGLTQSS